MDRKLRRESPATANIFERFDLSAQAHTEPHPGGDSSCHPGRADLTSTCSMPWHRYVGELASSGQQNRTFTHAHTRSMAITPKHAHPRVRQITGEDTALRKDMGTVDPFEGRTDCSRKRVYIGCLGHASLLKTPIFLVQLTTLLQQPPARTPRPFHPQTLSSREDPQDRPTTGRPVRDEHEINSIMEKGKMEDSETLPGRMAVSQRTRYFCSRVQVLMPWLLFRASYRRGEVTWSSCLSKYTGAQYAWVLGGSGRATLACRRDCSLSCRVVPGGPGAGLGIPDHLMRQEEKGFSWRWREGRRFGL